MSVGAPDGASWDNLLSDLSLNDGQLDEDGLSDVTFVVKQLQEEEEQEGQEVYKEVRFYAHRLLLSLRSPVFKAMFNGPLKESESSEIDIADISPEAFGAMLAFLYKGKSNSSEELRGYLTSPSNAWQLWYAAKKYMLDSLEQKCRKVSIIKRL